ncbi:MAG: rplB [Haloplasmataceae bacterium]|jgi:large subunit ribosomal protein L2|nr:rplB [Haloplasmataceae bacterium]
MSKNNKYLIKYNPLTPSLRHTCLVNKRYLNNNYKLNNLLVSINKVSGRNNTGQITVRHRGGGQKKIYRKIDHRRNLLNIPASVYTIEYDSFRSSFISLICFINGIYCYILSTQFDLRRKLFIYNYNNKVSYYHTGDSNLLLFFTNGTLIHNVEPFPGKGGLFSKAAGTSSLLINGDNKTTKIKIPSGRVIVLSSYCRASVGKVSNEWYRYINLGKAGRSRWLGIRPSVRGVAMNPIDHPHGGGEGKKTGRASPYSVWGRMQKTKH